MSSSFRFSIDPTSDRSFSLSLVRYRSAQDSIQQGEGNSNRSWRGVGFERKTLGDFFPVLNRLANGALEVKSKSKPYLKR